MKNIPWTLQEVSQEAKKYKTRGNFQKYSNTIYRFAHRHNLLNKVCAHMVPVRIFWSYNMIVKEARKYKTRREFELGSIKAYRAAVKRKILDKICKHMKYVRNTSILEETIFSIIKLKFPNAVKLKKRKIKIKRRKYIKGFDIDIFIPELNKGIEFDGTYYHKTSILKKCRPNWPKYAILSYHQIKDDYFLSSGIKILHVKEKDWRKNKEKCIEKCFNFLNKR